MKKLPKNSPFMYDIVLRLHQIGLSSTSEWRAEVDKQSVSNLYFEAQHRLLIMQSEQPWLASDAATPLAPENVLLYKAFTMAAQLFLWASMRHAQFCDDRSNLSISTGSGGLLFGRIKAALEIEGGYSSWARGKCLETVAWILFVCVESCPSVSPDWVWFLGELRRVLSSVRIRRIEEFRKVMQTFPSTDTFRDAEDKVWRAMAVLDQ